MIVSYVIGDFLGQPVVCHHTMGCSDVKFEENIKPSRSRSRKASLTRKVIKESKQKPSEL